MGQMSPNCPKHAAMTPNSKFMMQTFLLFPLFYGYILFSNHKKDHIVYYIRYLGFSSFTFNFRLQDLILDIPLDEVLFHSVQNFAY